MKFQLPPRMSEADLQKFVLDYLAGNILTNWSVPENILTMVFMPLAFGALAGMTKKQSVQIGCIYAHLQNDMATTTGRSVNGFPMFASMRLMLAEDWAIAKATILREQERGGPKVELAKP